MDEKASKLRKAGFLAALITAVSSIGLAYKTSTDPEVSEKIVEVTQEVVQQGELTRLENQLKNTNFYSDKGDNKLELKKHFDLIFSDDIKKKLSDSEIRTVLDSIKIILQKSNEMKNVYQDTNKENYNWYIQRYEPTLKKYIQLLTLTLRHYNPSNKDLLLFKLH